MLVDCVTLQLPKVHDPRGNLTFVEGGRQIPFDIRRVYYLYDVPGGSERGGHAHLALHQFVIAMSGSFDIVLDDGFDRKRYHLNRSYEGLYIPPMTWRELDNFSSGSVCMVLARPTTSGTTATSCWKCTAAIVRSTIMHRRLRMSAPSPEPPFQRRRQPLPGVSQPRRSLTWKQPS